MKKIFGGFLLLMALIFIGGVSPVWAVHGDFSTNQDACASCHSTHRGQAQYIIKSNVATLADVCDSCHNGTTQAPDTVGGYLPADPTTGDKARRSSGLFGLGTEDGLSRHDLETTKISAAPGGSGTNQDPLSCGSCHDPHGIGGNARLLNPDPNGAALDKKRYLDRLEKITNDPPTYVAELPNGDRETWLRGYPYSLYTAVYEGDTYLSADKYEISNANGYTEIIFNGSYKPNPNNIIKGSYVASVKVKMRITNDGQWNEQVVYRTGLDDFCGACHDDYNTEKVNQPTRHFNGDYSTYTRHKVGVNDNQSSFSFPRGQGLKYEMGNNADGPATLICLTCHLAHGIDKKYWQDTLNSNIQSYEIEGPPSLKRMPNMTSCQVCHKMPSKDEEGTNANSN